MVDYKKVQSPNISRCILIVPPEEKSIIDNEVGQVGVFPPLGLAYLAAVLRSNSIQVKIIDALGEVLKEDRLSG